MGNSASDLPSYQPIIDLPDGRRIVYYNPNYDPKMAAKELRALEESIRNKYGVESVSLMYQRLAKETNNPLIPVDVDLLVKGKKDAPSSLQGRYFILMPSDDPQKRLLGQLDEFSVAYTGNTATLRTEDVYSEDESEMDRKQTKPTTAANPDNAETSAEKEDLRFVKSEQSNEKLYWLKSGSVDMDAYTTRVKSTIELEREIQRLVQQRRRQHRQPQQQPQRLEIRTESSEHITDEQQATAETELLNVNRNPNHNTSNANTLQILDDDDETTAPTITIHQQPADE